MKDDRIVFATALRIIQPNMEAEDPLKSEWVIESQGIARPFQTSSNFGVSAVNSIGKLF